MRVLVVEDQAELADSIGRVLRREGMAVDVVYDGGAALERTIATDYDVLVLDRDIPVVHGDDVCRQLTGPRVLMLTASGTLADRVEGLNLGAEDYLPRRCGAADLTARFGASGRRSPQAVPT